MEVSPASAAKFVHPDGGLTQLKAILELYMDKDDFVADTAIAIATLCRSAPEWGDGFAVHYPKFLRQLEDDILPMLLRGIKQHKNSSTGEVRPHSA